MSQRRRRNPKKLFWIIVGVATVVGILAAVVVAQLRAPSAGGDTIEVSKIRGAIIFPVGAVPPAGTVTLYRVTSRGEQRAVSEATAYSRDNNERVTKTPNRTYSITSTKTLNYGETYRVKMDTGCFAEFTVPKFREIPIQIRAEILDKQFMPDTRDLLVAFIELPHIQADCVSGSTTPAPTDSPTNQSSTATTADSPSPALQNTQGGTTSSGASTNQSSSQTVKYVPFPSNACTDKYDVILVVDNSGTMDDEGGPLIGPGDTPAKILRQSVDRVVSKGLLNETGDRLGLITFSQPTREDEPLQTDFARVNAKVKDLSFGAGASNIADGVERASAVAKAARRSDANVVIVVLADGQATMGNRAITTAKQDAASGRVRYFTVSLGNRNSNLPDLAQAGGGAHTLITATSKIGNSVDSLIGQIDSLVSHCVTMKLDVAPKRFTTKQLATLMLNVTNHTRFPLAGVKVKQTLPSGLKTEGGESLFTATIDSIAVGATASQSTKVRGIN